MVNLILNIACKDGLAVGTRQVDHQHWSTGMQVVCGKFIEFGDGHDDGHG